MEINILLFVSVVLLTYGRSERIAKQIYEPINGALGCFRRFNGTHQFGCSSKPHGNVGVLHLIESIDDVSWIKEKGPHAPYIGLLTPKLFQRRLMMEIKDSGKFSGVIVFLRNGTSKETQKPDSFSIDGSCPNRATSFYAKHEEEDAYCSQNPWNPGSSEFLFEDWGFPIFYVEDVNSKTESCFVKHNQPSVDGTPRDWPLCAVELTSPMSGAVSTETCIRRGTLDSYINPQPGSFCDPLGDKNLFATVLPTNGSQETIRNRSLIFLTTRMDSMSLFEDVVPAADSVITSVAALLTVADLIGRVKDQLESALTSDISNVVFSVFNGEAFDYIGSSRAVYDMRRGEFPRPARDGVDGPASVRLEHVKYFIELEQVGGTDLSQEYFLHSDPISQKDPDVRNEVEKLKRVLRESTVGVQLKDAASGKPLPPASIQSFLKYDSRIPGVVITNHESSFKNKYYNSEYDTPEAVGYTTSRDALVKNIAALAAGVGNTVYKLATGQDLPSDAKVDESFVSQVLECFLVNNNCTLLRTVMNRNISGPPRPFYVGVSAPDSDYSGTANTPTLFIREILASRLGEKLPNLERDQCKPAPRDDIYHYSWIGDLPESRSPMCIRSTVKFTVAVSPAFVVEGYNWASAEYSTWSESRWQPFSVRLFLKGSSQYETTIFIIGCTVFLASSILIYLTSRRADVLFTGRIAGTS